jgi:hypothetical protein
MILEDEWVWIVLFSIFYCCTSSFDSTIRYQRSETLELCKDAEYWTPVECSRESKWYKHQAPWRNDECDGYVGMSPCHSSLDKLTTAWSRVQKQPSFFMPPFPFTFFFTIWLSIYIGLHTTTYSSTYALGKNRIYHHRRTWSEPLYSMSFRLTLRDR